MYEHINFILTNKCNSKCKYCYINADDTEKINLNTEDIFSFINRFKANGGESILFTGGEALMHPDIYKILEYTCQTGIECNLFTNGLLINKKNIDILRTYIDKFLISLDGPKFIHDKNRGISGAYEHTLEVLSMFKEESIRYSIQMTIDRKNIEYMNYTTDIADRYNAEGIKFTNIINIGRGKSCTENLDETELIKIKEKAELLSKQFDGLHVTTNLYNEWEINRYFPKDTVIPVIWIDKFGDIYLYSTIPNNKLKFGNIKTFNFENREDVWRSGSITLNNVIKGLNKCKICNLFEEIDKYIDKEFKGI